MKRSIITGAALAALTAAFSAPAAAQETTTAWSGAVPEVRHGEARFKPRGRWQYDIQSSDWDVLGEDGTRSTTRRLFLGAQGRFTERWRYKIDVVLTPSSDTIGVDDAFIEYNGGDWSIFFGEHNITSPLEDRISSLDIPLIERSSVINAFEYGRRAGVAFLRGGPNWSAAAAVQGDSFNNSDSDFSADEAYAISGRVTFAPVFESAPEGLTLVHLGLTARHRGAGDDNPIRYRARPLNGRGTRWIDAGAGLPGESDTSYGVELALQRGPFGLQAEYHALDGETLAGVGYDFDGYYVDAYWSLTGESRRYSGGTGSFGAIAPAHPVTEEGGWGHWMLSARYDFIDLSDSAGGAARGEQTAYAVGLDWVPLEHVRFKLNYALSDMDRVAGPDDEAQIATLRAQFDF